MLDYCTDDPIDYITELDLTVSKVNWDHISLLFNNLSNNDTTMALGSILFVYTFISVYLCSFFLGSMAMLNILLSFPMTLFFYKVIFQITFL